MVRTVPAPDDVSAVEYDAPPPAPANARMLTKTQMQQLVTRPASAIVDLASERAIAGVMPDYDAPPPATSARRR